MCFWKCLLIPRFWNPNLRALEISSCFSSWFLGRPQHKTIHGLAKDISLMCFWKCLLIPRFWNPNLRALEISSCFSSWFLGRPQHKTTYTIWEMGSCKVYATLRKSKLKLNLQSSDVIRIMKFQSCFHWVVKYRCEKHMAAAGGLLCIITMQQIKHVCTL